ncbi:MAG: ArsS family sensor histidine kinase [Sulfurospirillum sp.]
MLKKESIFFIITLSFIVSIVLIISSFYLLNKNLELQRYKYVENRISYFNHRAIIEALGDLNDLGYTYIDDRRKILKNSELLYSFKRGRKDIKYLKYNKKFYIYFVTPGGEILLEDRKHISYNKKLFVLIFLITIATLVSFYIVVIKKLLPLKRLHLQVKKLADENFDVTLDIKGDDEIATLTKEFKKSTQKLKELKLSRDIFIRNIMHELKTPITNGKLLTTLLPDKTNKELMEKVFYRMQNLIDEFSQIERFLSLKQNPDFKSYFLEDLIDSAVDISFFEERKVIKEYENIKLSVDFRLFIIALKNLIDNGVKYSKNQQVTIKTEDKTIEFINNAQKLKYPLENYLEPSYNQVSNKLSLGIYITNYILKSNHFQLDYRYENGQNIFIVKI